MADVVLDVHTKFSEGLVIAVRLEDGVVAEALSSPALSDDFTLNDALKLMDILDSGTTAGTDILLLY